MKLFRQGGRSENSAPVGYVDFASSTTVSGWVKTDLKNMEFFVEVDGVQQSVRLIFAARTDLIAQAIDGIGFETNFKAEKTIFDIRMGYISNMGSKQVMFIPFSATNESIFRIVEQSRLTAVLTAQELCELANSISPDSASYLSLAQKFGAIIHETNSKVDVLFIDGTSGSVSIRYRVINIAEGLQEIGYVTRYVVAGRETFNLVTLYSPRVVVFFRCALDDLNLQLVKQFRDKGARIIFDMDDLIIDETIIVDIDGVRHLDHATTMLYRDGVRLYRRFALEADLITTATPYLADYVETQLGVRPTVIRNSIGKSYLRYYSSDIYNTRHDSKTFVIGYYPGSKTHQEDFAQAEPGLIQFLRTYSHSQLRIVGMLDIDEFPDLKPLRAQITQLPTMPFHDMIADLGNCDIVIAPLVTGSPFCEAKSELKFFESALRGVPCVASATRTYIEATNNGTLAALAYKPEDWFSALSSFYLSDGLRRLTVAAARAHVLQNYSYAVAAIEAEHAYFGVANEPNRRVVENVLIATESIRTIGVIIPGIVVGGGGHRKILRFCKDWADAGFIITLYVDSDNSPARIMDEIRLNFHDFKCEIKNYRGLLKQHDVVVCTHWTTAYSLRDHPNPKQVFYFVQDYEPMFEAVSSSYVKAVGTYLMGFNIVCYGKWVADRIEREFGLSTHCIDFTMDKTIYKSKAGIRKVTDVLFFARPSQPRRCFELGVESLRLLFKGNKSFRISLFGENDYGDLGFPYFNYGQVKNLSDLANVYRGAKIGVCFSATNPSLVGYEMISSGLPIVDLRLPGSHHNFAGEEFVLYANPTAESVASTIAGAFLNQAQLNDRTLRGQQFVSLMPEDAHIGASFMAFVQSTLNQGA